MTIAVGIAGYGQIAKTRHVPAIGESDRFSLRSIADPAATEVAEPAVSRYGDIDGMLAAADAPDAVIVCTPPQARYVVARQALEQGKHVMLEKPPGATAAEVEALAAVAERSGSTLFCAWHSRFAPAVRPARDWLADRRPRRVRIEWREDVRVWHPGQRWIWEPGGFGVFDPGINALSVALEILAGPFFLTDALLRVPENRATPISAELTLSDADDLDITAAFDFDQPGPPRWDIEVETDDGRLLLAEGGARLVLGEHETALGPRQEYEALYARFADLIATGSSDVDLEPLRLVADACLRGRRITVPPFAEGVPSAEGKTG